jgi:hypothetical protein
MAGLSVLLQDDRITQLLTLCALRLVHELHLCRHTTLLNHLIDRSSSEFASNLEAKMFGHDVDHSEHAVRRHTRSRKIHDEQPDKVWDLSLLANLEDTSVQLDPALCLLDNLAKALGKPVASPLQLSFLLLCVLQVGLQGSDSLSVPIFTDDSSCKLLQKRQFEHLGRLLCAL